MRFVALLLLFGTVLGGTSFAHAASAPAARDGVGATVITDGAIIYAAPDFDSTVLTQLPGGKKIRISKGKAGTQAQFYKVRVGNKIGFIADIDAKPDGGRAPPKPGLKNKRPGKNAKSDKKKPPEKEKDPNRNPIYFTRFVGLLVGYSEFKEGISGADSQTAFPVYGLKITGPDVLISAAVLDLNLALHYGAPSYYEKLSSTKPIGFLLLADAELMLPFMQANDHMLYLEGGPLLVWSKFNVFNNNKSQDLTSLNLGFVAGAGGAIRVGKVGLRLEAKYFIEKQQYKSIQLAVQTAF